MGRDERVPPILVLFRVFSWLIFSRAFIREDSRYSRVVNSFRLFRVFRGPKNR